LIKQTAEDDTPVLREHQLQLALFQKNEQQQIVATTVKPIKVSGELTRLEQFTGLACPLLVDPNYADWSYVKVQLDGNINR